MTTLALGQVFTIVVLAIAAAFLARAVSVTGRAAPVAAPNTKATHAMEAVSAISYCRGIPVFFLA